MGETGTAYTGPREMVIIRNRMGVLQGTALQHPVTKRLSRHNSYTNWSVLTNTMMCVCLCVCETRGLKEEWGLISVHLGVNSGGEASSCAAHWDTAR